MPSTRTMSQVGACADKKPVRRSNSINKLMMIINESPTIHFKTLCFCSKVHLSSQENKLLKLIHWQ
ncbi:MAG: hypothetical protein K0S80_3767 [Neobacillus sp.]|jgi:hypothetical protein|nr:hypothetical protein [Neobacillus sp.]